MKKVIKKTATLFLTLFFIVGCNSDYFDVNTPYNASDVESLGMNDLLGPVIYHTVTAQYSAERSFGNYSQYFTGQTGSATGQTSISGAWNQIYLYAMPNLKVISEKAETKNAVSFGAVAKILTAINLGIATDSWGNIPYSDAAKGEENIKPSFDTQEEIYKNIDKLLTEAIKGLEGTDDTTFKPSDKNDLIYHGDLSKWLRAAYTLRARYKLHLSEIDGTSKMASILADLSKGFTSNDDDFQMLYTDKNINPWYSREVLAKNTGNDHDKIGDQLVSYMNGNSYPFSTITLDPRLPIYAENTGDDGADWKGYVSGGNGLSSDGTTNGNTDFAIDGYYTNGTAPIVVISYSEALFMKAEAAFLLNGGTETSTGTNTDSYNAYKTGIEASMDKLGVKGTDKDAYLADASIDVGQGSLMLNNIMREKYIANFLNPETFVDLRRYDFSPNVFKDLALPANNVDSEFPGKWLVRAIYPATEESGNSENAAANKKAPTEPVWWDK